MKSVVVQVFSLVVFLCCVDSALAVVRVIDKDAPKLEIEADAVYTDNLNPTIEQDIAAIGFQLKPKGQLLYTGEGVWLVADYQADIETYELQDEIAEFDSTQDFNSYNAGLLARIFIGQAFHLDASVKHGKETQKFGTGISSQRKDIFEADELTQNTAAVALVYGNDTSTRYASLEYVVDDFSYEPFNDNSDFFDLRMSSVRLNLAYRLSSFSRFVVRLEASDEDYQAIDREDSKFYQGLMGFDWKPTGKSSVQAMLGMYQRDLESLPSNSGLTWFFQYSYSPSESWLLELNSASLTEASKSEVTNDTLSQNVGAKLSYALSEQWQVGGYFNQKVTTFFETEREYEQKEREAWLEIEAVVRDYSKLNFKVGTSAVSTNDRFIDYNQNELRLSWSYVF